MGPIGMQEILVILVLALIFLGPKKLPELASGIGKAIREIRKATADIRGEIELDEAIRRPLEELREATMLPPEELKRRDEEKKWRAQREREDAEAAARGETADSSGVVSSPVDSYNATSDDDYHAYHAGHGSSGMGEDFVVPDDDVSLSPGGAPAADLTTQDLPPVSPAVLSPSSPVPVAVTPAPSSRALSAPVPNAVATANSSSISRPARPLPPRPDGAPDDRTIAMPLPPPMEGGPAPTLPRPLPRPLSTGAPRTAPPPPPLDAMRTPVGAVARPKATLFGVPSAPVPVAPAPAPIASESSKNVAPPPRSPSSLGVKLPEVPPKKT